MIPFLSRSRRAHACSIYASTQESLMELCTVSIFSTVPFHLTDLYWGSLKTAMHSSKTTTTQKKHELIILQFQEFKNFRPSDYERLLTQLTQGFSGTGSSTKILPRAASDLTIRDVRSRYVGHNIIIASDKFGSHSDVWNDISHEWIGHDIPSEQELDIFIDQKTQETNQSKLWSLQSVRYKNFMAPWIFLTTSTKNSNLMLKH